MLFKANLPGDIYLCWYITYMSAKYYYYQQLESAQTAYLSHTVISLCVHKSNTGEWTQYLRHIIDFPL